MNILLVTNVSRSENESDVHYTGVEYYRMVNPHFMLQELYPEYNFIVTPKQDFDLDNEVLNSIKTREERVQFIKDLIKPFDLILFNRDVPKPARDLIKEEGKDYAFDLDDYWILPGYHLLYDHYQKNDIKTLTEDSIREAKFVICSTPILADKAKPFNENVYVIENGLNFEEETWKTNKTESNRLRFGFTQSGSHYEDMKVMFKSIRRALENPLFQRCGQIVACGFQKPKDPAEFDKEIMIYKSFGKETTELEKQKEESIKALKWEKTNVSQAIEVEITDGFRLIHNKVYSSCLFKWAEYNDRNEVYRRMTSTNVLEFGNVYNEFDVSVTYLKDKVFNSCKSELKLLEAGAKGKAIMCNHIKPYTYVANDKNSFDLFKKTFNEWSIYLIKNPNLVSDSASQLREDVQKYDLKKLSVKRNEIYQKYGRDTKSI